MRYRASVFSSSLGKTRRACGRGRGRSRGRGSRETFLDWDARRSQEVPARMHTCVQKVVKYWEKRPKRVCKAEREKSSTKLFGPASAPLLRDVR